MQDPKVLEDLSILKSQLSVDHLGGSVDIESIYNSFCGLIKDQLVTVTVGQQGSSSHKKGWWNVDLNN